MGYLKTLPPGNKQMTLANESPSREISFISDILNRRLLSGVRYYGVRRTQRQYIDTEIVVEK
jgi:hypothetical protein